MMMTTRLAVAASVLALAAAAHAPRAKPIPAGPVTVVRAVAISRTAQTGHAYAASAEAKYVTEFPNVLEVGTIPAASKNSERRIRFTCITKPCTFVATENQPYEAKFIDRLDDRTYKVRVVDGKASIRLSIEGPEHGGPAQTYTVRAEPSVQKNERNMVAVPVLFTLTTR